MSEKTIEERVADLENNVEKHDFRLDALSRVSGDYGLELMRLSRDQAYTRALDQIRDQIRAPAPARPAPAPARPAPSPILYGILFLVAMLPFSTSMVETKLQPRERRPCSKTEI